jgi:hypothetical protein
MENGGNEKEGSPSQHARIKEPSKGTDSSIVYCASVLTIAAITPATLSTIVNHLTWGCVEAPAVLEFFARGRQHHFQDLSSAPVI